MNTLRPSRILADERGIALAMSLMVLLVLSALVLAFSTLSSTEPTIANNHARVAQARTIAEAGVERALWALNNPGTQPGYLNYDPNNGIPLTSPDPPYDGSEAVALAVDGTQRGVFEVFMTAGMDPDKVPPSTTPWRVDVDSRGWVPDNSKATNPHQRITATFMKLRNIASDARCALCVRGGLRVWGSSVVDSRPAIGDANCGSEAMQRRPGTFSTGYTQDPGGNSRILGSLRPEGNISNNEYDPLRSNDVNHVGENFDIISPNVGDASGPFQDVFDQFALQPHEIETLKALAKARGTYWGPNSNPIVSGGQVTGNNTSQSYDGKVKFTGNGDIPDGIIFIDTVDGQKPTATSTNLAKVEIHGNSTFNGWIFVNGSLLISGGININGLVYAANDIDYRGTGNGRIAGQVISGNIQNTGVTQVEDSTDSTTTGNALIQMNCEYVRNGGADGGFLPQKWFPVAGTYKERERGD